MEAVPQIPNGRGLGVFHWEPEWIPVKGAEWAKGQGNAWESLAIFEFDGNALPLLNVFNLVRPENGGATVAPQVVEVNLIEVFVPLSEKNRTSSHCKSDLQS